MPLTKILMALIHAAIIGISAATPAAATLLALQVGLEGPAFSLKDFSGQAVQSKDLQGGKLTVLVFWSTWSRRSEAVLARMQKLYDRYKEKGLSVVGINADGQAVGEKALGEIRAVKERLKLTYPFLLDDGLAAFHDYGVIALPTTIVMDARRNITHELSGYPLVGSEQLVDHLTSFMEGKDDSAAKESTTYVPNKNAVRLYNMGKNTLKSKRMKDTAEEWFKKAAEADPGFLLPRLSLGNLYRSQGDQMKAMAQFREVLAKDPRNTIALCEGGNILVQQGQHAEGSAMLEAAVKGETSYPPCYYYLGYAAGKAGKVEAALPLFEEAEKMAPRDSSLFVMKGVLLEERNDLKGAAAAYRKAVEILLQQMAGR